MSDSSSKLNRKQTSFKKQALSTIDTAFQMITEYQEQLVFVTDPKEQRQLEYKIQQLQKLSSPVEDCVNNLNQFTKKALRISCKAALWSLKAETGIISRWDMRLVLAQLSQFVSESKTAQRVIRATEFSLIVLAVGLVTITIDREGAKARLEKEAAQVRQATTLKEEQAKKEKEDFCNAYIAQTKSLQIAVLKEVEVTTTKEKPDTLQDSSDISRIMVTPPYDNQIYPRVVETEVFNQCRDYFDYSVKISRVDYPGEINYQAVIAPLRLGKCLGSAANPAKCLKSEQTLIAIGSPAEECGYKRGILGRLAYKIIGSVGGTPEPKVEDEPKEKTSLDPQEKCRIYELNLEGYTAYQKGLYTNAKDALGKAIELDPQYAVAHNNLGLVNLQLQLYDEAIGNFQEATKWAGNYALFWLNLGKAYYWKEQKAKLEAASKRSQIFLTEPGGTEKDFLKAEAALKRVLEINPYNIDAYIVLSVIQRERNNIAQAEKTLQNITDKYFDVIKNNDERLQTQQIFYASWGKLEVYKKNWPKAIENLQKAIAVPVAFYKEEISYYLFVSYQEYTGRQNKNEACDYWRRYDAALNETNRFRVDGLERRQLDAGRREQMLNCS